MRTITEVLDRLRDLEAERATLGAGPSRDKAIQVLRWVLGEEAK